MSNSNVPTKVFIQNDYLLRQNSNGWIEKEQDVNQHTTPFRFVPKGLYDPLVFNHNNKCICSMQTRYIDRPVQCPRCKVTVVSDEEYMNNYALYKMNIPYVNFIKVEALINQLKLAIKTPFPIRSLQDLWSLYLLDDEQPFMVNDYEAQLFYDRDGKEHYVAFTDLPGDNPEDIPTKDALGKKITIENMGLFGIKKLSYFYTADAIQLNKIGDLINEYLVITSPGRRPLHIFKDNSGKPVITVPEETISYRCIMFMNKQVGTYLDLKTISITDKATYCWYLNVMVNSHFTSNELLQPSKQSLGRTILDTRVTNSFRALIVADVELPMDTVGLPETYVYKCLQKNIIEEISQELVTQRKIKGGKKLVNQELADLDAKKHYLNKTDLAMKIFYEMVESYQDENGEWIVPAMCTLVRNPSLHKFNLMAYKIKLVKDTAIHLAISVDESYNADHF